MNELERVALLAACFGQPAEGVGIGDDAAVVAPGAEPLVWTVDAQVEGTHFRLDWLDWEDVGFRSFMAAASDLAAMGAVPVAALSSLVLADEVDDAALAALARGQADAARAIGTTVIGGNLAGGRETSVTTTLLGRTARPILRRGARPGDGVYLGGEVGLAAAGLAALSAAIDLSDRSFGPCLAAWRRPRARIDLGKAMACVATAAVDVSDGLWRDAGHLADASGVTLELEDDALDALVGPDLAAAAARLARDPRALVLGGGEDYALVVTSPEPIAGFVRIGSVVPRGAASVLVGGRAEGHQGFDHFD